MKLKHVKHIAIIGTGMIGASLAVLCTGNSYKTTMLALNDTEADAGQASYNTYYNDLISQKLVSAKQAQACAKLLNITKNYKDIEDADLIFECLNVLMLSTVSIKKLNSTVPTSKLLPLPLLLSQQKI